MGETDLHLAMRTETGWTPFKFGGGGGVQGDLSSVLTVGFQAFSTVYFRK